MSLQHAKEKTVLEVIKKVEENDRRTQSIDLSGSSVFREKSVKLSASLADALSRNTRLTALDLSNCSIGDVSAKQLSAALADNATLFELNLSYNKLGRQGLMDIAKALSTNVGLKSVSLASHRVDSSVAHAYVQMFYTNVTLLTLTWDVNLPAFNLKLTEMINRNNEINRLLLEGKDYRPKLPLEMKDDPPELVERLVPEMGDEEFGMELGGAGTTLWCSVSGRWELGTLKGSQKKGMAAAKLVVEVEGEEHLVEQKDVTRFEPSHAQDLPNMVAMHNLHEAPLLYLLQRRLKNGSIYTWAGDVLLSLNPYGPLPELYNLSRWQEDNSAKKREAAVPPHVYAIARRAYSQLREKVGMAEAERAAAAASGAFASQSVLISGESGAGKTEAAKRVIEFLTAASRTAKEARGSMRSVDDSNRQSIESSVAAASTRASLEMPSTPLAAVAESRTASFRTPASRARHASLAATTPAPDAAFFSPAVGVAEQPAVVSVELLLRDASPILEAFGNAKTIRNDNSSRFGKYVAVQYDEHGCIAGASTETYLLERSRVVDISAGERNYHIFYQLLTDSGIRSAWSLPPAESLDVLNVDGQVARLAGVSDAKEFAVVRRALPAFGIGPPEQAAVWRILSAVLLLGNLAFSLASDAAGADDYAQVADDAALACAAAALGCEEGSLRVALLQKKINVAGEDITQRYSIKAAQICRDALCKSIFAALFDWVVGRINAVSRSANPRSSSIGILDIFGFEQLQTNSFEQLCINFVNEMLQEQFNESVFAAERRLFAAEGVEVEDGSLQSSAERLRLMTRMLQGLDDQCRLGERGSDEEFFQEIGQKHTVRGICQQEQRGVFSISHYAGKVFYTTDGFVLKNSDQLPPDVTALFATCVGLESVITILNGGTPADAGRLSAADPRASATTSASSVRDSAPSGAGPAGGGGGVSAFKLNLSLANARASQIEEAQATARGVGGAGRGGRQPPMGPLTERGNGGGGGGAPMMTARGGRKGGGKMTTLSERLRAGIGQVSGSGGKATEGLMATLQVTTLHYIRCVKPNDGMAAFGFEQARVLRQLQYSGVLEMVRIRRSGFPNRMPFAEFETKFGALLLGLEAARKKKEEESIELTKNDRAKSKMRSSLDGRTMSLRRGSGAAKALAAKIGIGGAAAKSEANQAQAELEAQSALGRGDCLLILRQANLHEYRHYQFGKTLVFLRNGVEAMLNNAVSSRMKAVLWFQKLARGRVARAAFATRQEELLAVRAAAEAARAKRAAASAVLQAAGRGQAARAEARARRRAAARRHGALVMVAHGTVISKTVAARKEAWLAERRQARAALAPYALGFCGRLRARRKREEAQRSQPLRVLRRALRRGVLLVAALKLMRQGVARRKLQAVTRRRSAAREATQRRESIAALQRVRRGHKAREEAKQRRLAVSHLQALYRSLRERLWSGSVFGAACDDVFTAAYEDDEEALMPLLKSHAALLLVRQNVPGQRASLAHAAAAGGATRVAPALFVHMWRSATGSGAPSRSDDPVTELRAALAYCAHLRDVEGRTPLHYAARAGRLAFLQWASRLLSVRPAGYQEEGGADAAAEEDSTELRRAVLPAVLPGSSGRKKVLVVLRQSTLQVLPVDAANSIAGPPLLSLPCDKLLYRRAEERGKKDVLEVVMLQRPGRRQMKQVAAVFEQSGNEDVLELQMANAAEARAWMAAFHNPRYLHARGLHLASVVAGREAASEQIDLWERWAVINHRDSRGETMLHAALRGIEPGEADERQRLVAWLVDCGATLLPQPAGAPTDELLASLYKRFSSPRLGKGKSKSRAAFAEEAAAPPADEADEEVSDVPSPFALAVRLADGEGLDGLLAEAVVTMARQGAPLVGPASIDDHLSTLLHGWLDGADTAPLTHAALGTWRDANGVEPAHHMQPPPPPTTSAQNRALVLLSLSRLDCAAEPASARLAISVVHEPSSDAAGPRGGAGLASRAAAFQATEAAGAGGGGGGGGLMRRNRLATLVGEQQCASPLSSSAVGCLWWFRTWSAAYLQGEEGAMLLIKLVRATGGGEDEVLSWVALPLDEVGDHHLQMHAPPLPKSAAEARAPRSEPTSAWLHCCLDLGVTGTYAAFASRHPDLSRGPATVHRVEPLERKYSIAFHPAIRGQQAAAPKSPGSPPLRRAQPPPPRTPPRRPASAATTPAPPTSCDTSPDSAAGTQPRAPPLPSSPPPPTPAPPPEAPQAEPAQAEAPSPPSPPKTRSKSGARLGAVSEESVAEESVAETAGQPPETAGQPPAPDVKVETLLARELEERAVAEQARRGAPKATRQTSRALELLRRLPEAAPDLVPVLTSVPPAETAAALDQERRTRVVELVQAAAAAARHGEHDLAARGYLHAFGLCGAASLLISVGHMLIKLGIGDAARAIFEHLLTLPASLSPEQQSLVKRRIAQLKAGEPAAKMTPSLLLTPATASLLPPAARAKATQRSSFGRISLPADGSQRWSASSEERDTSPVQFTPRSRQSYTMDL